MKSKAVQVTGVIPEHVNLNFETTGSQGGDAGHGGSADLTIESESQPLHLTIQSTDGSVVEIEADKIEIAVFGDWELAGLELGLFEMGRKLMMQQDTWDAYVNWKNGD